MTTVVTSGAFPSTDPSLSQADGLGTADIRWGSSGSQSGYQFRGAAADVQLDGTEFVVGTFVHRNMPTNVSPSQFDVKLTVNVMFEDGSTTGLDFSFHHHETPNSTGSSPADDDLVDLETFVHPQPVTVAGKQYKAVLSGFKRNGQVVRQFRSPEGGINFAEVVCMFTADEPDVIISDLRYLGTGQGQPDEYVEIFNKGGAPQDLTGWVVECKTTGHAFTFPPGTVIQPGQRYRVHTNETHREFGGFSFGSSQEVWRDQGGIARLRHDDFVVDQYPYLDKGFNRTGTP
ncbi:lamin tail domain-containing protein [Streptomyces sp. TG1A-8]|uniref:lamin tail domain-containing protein n=1 Tax=Streptomyces sp. TG1A-8 TaxID=3051385 RepID=UPI00265C1D8B|nr:lamin tail domain-containing protein [Streptomyces sp. TG1A-8]MDO0924186.1 lamin tail domain-containing protein [Streptomyces sp. TG1A-8]